MRPVLQQFASSRQICRTTVIIQRSIFTSPVTRAEAAPDQAQAAVRKYPRHLRRTQQDEDDLLWDLDDVEEEDERHMSSYGWEIHRQQREFFNMMRVLERDGPNLRKYQRPFSPPDPSKTPVLVRSVTYAGEPHHPVAEKRTVVVPISHLGLTNEEAFHNLKVITGSRWTLEVPKDSGLPQSNHEPVYEGQSTTTSDTSKSNSPDPHGYIKISCENFPDGTMNLKWCMDVLRRLVKEANERSTSSSPDASFKDIPLPTRHHDSRLRAHGTGGSSFKAERKRVTIADFPKEWLPSTASKSK